MIENFDGYKFHVDNDGHIFNSTLCIFFMDNYLRTNKYYANDDNVDPSETSIKFVSKHPKLSVILSDLFSKGKILIPLKENKPPIKDTIKIEELMNVNNMEYLTLVSYLFFTGGLTFGNKTEKEVELKIPNNAKDDYIQEIKSYYELLKDSDKLGTKI